MRSVLDTRDETPAVPPARQQRRPSGTVRLWAALGLALVTLSTVTWTRWAFSDHPGGVDTGPDDYDWMWVLRLTEVVSSGVFVFLLWYTLLRPAYREHRITLDGKLFLGGFFASCLDVLCQVYNPTWAMNAHALTLGTWANEFPGFGSPGQEDWAWGLAWCLPAYIWLGVGAAIVGCAYLAALRRRFPHLTTVTMYLIVLASFMVVFGAVATIWNRTEVYTYVSSPDALTLWSGETYRLPVTELLFISSYCLMFTWLRDSRDENGRCAVDRDIHTLPIGQRAKTLVSTLAVIGFAGFITMAAYQIPNSWISMQGGQDSIPEQPSYLQGSLYCGQDGKPLCPGQYLEKLHDDYEGAQDRLVPEQPSPAPGA